MSDEVQNEAEALRRQEVDSRRIIVELIPDHLKPPVEVWTADLWDAVSGGDIPFDVMAELTVALRAGGTFPPYVLTSRRTYVNWGADASAEDIVLEVASWALEGIAASAAYEALRRTVSRIVRRARSTGQGLVLPPPLSEQEAAERGRWTVMHKFGLSDKEARQLVVVGAEELEDGSRVVRYAIGDRRWEVELVEADGLVTIARVGWRHLADSSGQAPPA